MVTLWLKRLFSFVMEPNLNVSNETERIYCNVIASHCIKSIKRDCITLNHGSVTHVTTHHVNHAPHANVM